MGNVVTQTALVTPTSGTSTGALADYEMAKFRENNGTVSVGVDILTGDIVASIGTIDSGTITRLEQGSINVTKGTVSAGTINTGTINAGTVDLLKAGTITALANGTIGAGTLNTLGTVGTIVGIGGTVIVDIAGTEPIIVEVGTIAAGTLNTLGTVANVNAGSITVIAGTVTTGSLSNVAMLNAGTVSMINAGTITSVTTVSNLTNGSVNILVGTTPLRSSTIGAVNVGIWGNALALGDAETNSPFLWYNTDNNTAESKRVYPMQFNGVTWDRQRNNSGVTEGTVIAGTTTDTSFNSTDQTNYNWRGAKFYLDVTGTSGALGTLLLAIQSKDPVSGKYFTLNGGTLSEWSGIGSAALTIYPGIAVNAGTTVNQVLPRTYRAGVTLSGGTFTF